jgi:hypothetical protein
MTVKNQHSAYIAMADKWNRCNDVCKGQDAIHAGDAGYLPKLLDQSEPEYQNYKLRTPFYNATWRTVVGLQGMLFRKPPKVITPASVVPMLENVTLTGTPLHIFALEISEECLKVGRVGVFVDFPKVPETATAADAIDGNYRPSMSMYNALSILNWKTKTIRNATILSMVVLQECVDKPIDEFTDEAEIQYRVLDLAPLTLPDGSTIDAYRVRVFIVEDNGGNSIPVDVVIDGPYFPMVNGKHLEEIPFQFIGVDDVSWNVDEPPLIDLVDMNLSHYRTTADYEHGCHFTGLPTPVISGYTADPSKAEKFYIGSMTAWVFPNPNATAKYLEFTGQGLKALSDNLAKKEGHMAILGARMLEVQVRGVESANTASIHRGGEQSMLASVAQAISIGFTKALKIFTQFAGAEGEVKFELNRDFFPAPMDALTITALIAGWQNGAYSYDTMFYNLQQGEIIPLENTAEQEQADIAANPAPLPQTAGTTPGNVHPSAPKGSATPATPAPTITQLQNIPVAPAVKNPTNG